MTRIATSFGPCAPCRASRGQRGVVLIITLFALLVLMVGSVALIRSMDTSSLLAGNLAFKRDLVNHGERGMAQALTVLRTGALSTEATRQAALLTSNYSPTVWASDARGIPNVLADEAAYTAAGLSGADINDAAAGVTVRYVIDRQCVAGTTVFDPAACLIASTKGDTGGTEGMQRPGGEIRPVYRISVRVSGPRGTQSFLQNTVVM